MVCPMQPQHAPVATVVAAGRYVVPIPLCSAPCKKPRQRCGSEDGLVNLCNVLPRHACMIRECHQSRARKMHCGLSESCWVGSELRAGAMSVRHCSQRGQPDDLPWCVTVLPVWSSSLRRRVSSMRRFSMRKVQWCGMLLANLVASFKLGGGMQNLSAAGHLRHFTSHPMCQMAWVKAKTPFRPAHHETSMMAKGAICASACGG